MKGFRGIAGLTGLALVIALLAFSAMAQSTNSKPQEGPPPTGDSSLPPLSLPAVSPTATPGNVALPVPGPDMAHGKQTEKSASRQEPAVSLEWNNPAQVKIGKQADYKLAVRNTANIPVQEVMVRVQIPNGMSVQNTEPKANVEGNVYWWELGTLAAKQETNLQIRMTPSAGGNWNCHAWVTFTGASSLKIKVGEPRLILKTTAPEKALVGNPTNFMMTVSNIGDAPADQVKMRVNLSDGLEHPKGKTVDIAVGQLAPNESRTVQVNCMTKTTGDQKCEGIVEAEGNLKAQDQATVNVVVPRLDLEVLGPKVRYLNRKAVYSFKVTNPNDSPIGNVMVQDVIPTGFKLMSAGPGGRHDNATQTVSWSLGEMAPHQQKEVKVEMLAINPGDNRHKVMVQGNRGVRAEQEIHTRIEAMSALLLEVVDIEDPIEVGAETAYDVRITNVGSKIESDVKLTCLIPDKMQFKTATGPVRYQEQGRQITFDALPPLPPKGEANFRIHVKGIAAGDVRFKVQVTSANLAEPIVELETTKIYED
ncbi:MAG TPA: CARDB domain-containing protein [Gemmataceae bacterium]|nr:CARDB domain-containing protein [Gemmataceae bacterium]